jgi:acyl-CoA thioester hydrolase
MIEYISEIRVRYGETDQMGYVYYGNYALYCEVGRTELLRSLGLTYRLYNENNENNELVNTSQSTLGFMDAKTNKPVRPPKFFLDIINPYF